MAYNKETKMYEGYIYCITNKINGKQYIGQTSRNLDVRWDEHIRAMKNIKSKSTYIHESMRKHGIINFSITLIAVLTSDDKNKLLYILNEEEIKYIASYNSLRPNGYNECEGGFNLVNTIAEKPVVQYDLECNIINNYSSVSEASRQSGCDQSDISYCCANKKVKTVGGFIWRFEGDIPKSNIQPKNKKVCQYDFNGNLINTFNSMSEAANSCITGKDNIGKSCSGKTISVGGYIWRFYKDSFNKYPTYKTKYIEIIQCDLYGNYINIFLSQTEASKKTGINASNINAVLKGVNKSAGGFLWHYATEEEILLYKKEGEIN